MKNKWIELGGRIGSAIVSALVVAIVAYQAIREKVISIEGDQQYLSASFQEHKTFSSNRFREINEHMLERDDAIRKEFIAQLDGLNKRFDMALEMAKRND